MTQTRPDRPRWAWLAVIAAVVVIAAHGLVHLVSVALRKLGEPTRLRYTEAVAAPGSVGGRAAGLADGLMLALVAASRLRPRAVAS
jgi:hypothetical protein